MDKVSSAGDPSESFMGAFALLDVRGFGKIGLEAIFDFVSAVPKPPSIEDVTVMYNEHDEDGSGDIDSGEFVGFIEALERVTGHTASEMIRFFERKQYENLFNLVDDDGGGTVSCQELKVLVESIHGMLDLRMSAADVRNLMRQYDADELEFEDFYNLMKKIAGNKSILLVVRAFEEARRRSKENLANTIMRFEAQNMADEKKSPLPQHAPRTRMRSATIQCPSCKKKDAELEFLRRRVAELEAREAEAQAQAQQAQAKVQENIEPRVRMAFHALDIASGLVAKFPAVKVPATNYERSHRLREVLHHSARVDASELQKQATTLADLADSTHKAQRHVAPTIDQPGDIAVKIIEEYRDFVKVASTGECGKADATAASERVTSLKMQLLAMSEALEWSIEGAIAARQAIVDQVASLLPFVSRPQKQAGVCVEAENVSQQLLDTAALLHWYGSENPSEVELMMEIAATGDLTVSEEDWTRISDNLDADNSQLSTDGRTTLMTRLKKTAYAVQAVGQSLATATRRDRGVGTGSLESILPAEPLARRMPEPRHAPGSGAPERGMMSRPPRERAGVYVEKDKRDGVVQKLLGRYLTSGVCVPDNFIRVYTSDPKDSERHFYRFGTRRIELVVTEDALAVKVGGGYLYFEEFCEMYTEMEVSRLNRVIGRSPSPNASPSPPRSGSRFTDPARSASATNAPQQFFSNRRGISQQQLSAGASDVVLRRLDRAKSPVSQSPSRRSPFPERA